MKIPKRMLTKIIEINEYMPITLPKPKARENNRLIEPKKPKLEETEFNVVISKIKTLSKQNSIAENIAIRAYFQFDRMFFRESIE